MPRALCRSEVLAKERIEKEGGRGRGGVGMQFCSRRLLWSAKTTSARRGRAGLALGGRKGRASARAVAWLCCPSRGRVGEEGKGREGGELGERKKMQRRVSKGVTNEVRSGRDTRESTFKLTKLLGHQFTLIDDKFRHHHFFVTTLSEGGEGHFVVPFSNSSLSLWRRRTTVS